ncbi:MAG: hypothetical protein QOG90_1012 [Actinomycetota bacterium]
MRPAGVVAVPVAPLLTLVAVSLFGVKVAFVGLGAVVSCAPATGAYVVLRRIAPSPVGLLLAALLLFGAAAGEAASWGGYPQLIGLGLVPVAVYLVDRALVSPRLSRAVAAGALLLALALSSDFVFALGAGAVATLLVVHVAERPREFGAVVRRAVLAAVPLLVAAPWYVQLARARLGAVAQPAAVTRPDQPNVWLRTEAVWFDAPTVWRALTLAAVIGVLLLWSHRRDPVWRVGAALLLPSLVAVAVWPETRLAYFLPTAVVLGAAVWATAEDSGRSIAVPLLASAALIAQLAVFPSTSSLQQRRYQALTPELLRGIDWLRSQTPPNSTVVVTPLRTAPPLAWWIEGVARRRTLAASSDAWVYFPVERRNAAKAARVLSAGVPTPATLAAARRFRADFVFVDKGWSDYQSGRIASLKRELPGVVAFENRGVVILRTGTAVSMRTRSA